MATPPHDRSDDGPEVVDPTGAPPPVIRQSPAGGVPHVVDFASIAQNARYKGLIAFSILGISVTAAFVAINTHRGMYAVVALNFAMLMIAATGLVVLVRTRNIFVGTLFLLAMALLFTLRLAIDSQIQGYMWSYMLPGILFFLLGLRKGLIFNAGVLVILQTILWLQPSPTLRETPPEVSIAGSYLVVLLFAWATEVVRHRYEQELRRISVVDALTGLWNRRKFEENLTAEIGRARRYRRPLSLLIFDVDHFKQINDELGHPVGDAVLKRIANTIRAHVRSADTLARLGGDEFVVLAPETPTGDSPDAPAEVMQTAAIGMAGRLCAAVRESHAGKEPRVSISMGVTSFHPDDTREVFLQRADEALYDVKVAGRNGFALRRRGEDRPALVLAKGYVGAQQ